MGKINRKFDMEFKHRICEIIRGRYQSISDVCREYQLARSMVSLWLKAYDEGTLVEKGSRREQQLEKENERLKAKVGELTMQLDVLKKMSAWKQRERNVASSIVTEDNLDQFQKPVEQSESQSQPTTTSAKRTR